MGHKIKVFFNDDNGNSINLYPMSISETTDTIEIITGIRTSKLKRGSMGDLIFLSKCPLDDIEITDCHSDILLQRVEVWSEEPEQVTEWKYIFLKN